jgi:tryptophanyl-tRNA synthetase
MHFGHKLVMDQVTYYQKLGADVTITVADIEAYATRGMSLEKAREYAYRYYIPYYLALGLDVKTASLYFQSQRQAVKDLAWKLGRKVNWSAMEAIYGFGGQTNMGHAVAPLVQVGDILHVQEPQRGGPRPVVVPVGVDQDPHIRLTRDLAVANRLLKLQAEGSEALVTVSDSQNEAAVAALFAALRDEVERRAQTDAFRASETSREFYKEWRKESDRASRQPSREAHLKAILLAARGLALEPLGFDKRAVTPNAPHGVMGVAGFTPDVAPDVDKALARVEQAAGGFGFLPPAATYHRFMQGLQGGKMSSSKPESHVSLEDSPDEAARKMGAALTGGRETAEEQRRLGGRAEECMVYETYVYHLVPDPKELQSLYERCKSGAMLCGECKGIAKEKVRAFMKDLHEKMAEREHLVKELVRET